MERQLVGESPTEYFKVLVEEALVRQRVRARELTAYYLVNLLTQYVRLEAGPESDVDAPLATRLARALDSGGREQRELLRRLGDFSLFVSGFFSDSLQRRSVDVDYYVFMGEYAYRSLSRTDSGAFAVVFAELSRKFVPFTDVLADISEQTSIISDVDLMRLYEKWLRTGSRRAGQKLAHKGIAPNASIGKRFFQ